MKKNLFVKIFVAIFFCIGCGQVLNAQDVFAKGNKVASLGIGLGTFGGSSGYSNSILPISGSFEIGVVDNLLNGNASIGIGGYLAYTSWKYEKLDWGYSDFIIGPRGIFHYQFIDKLDTYAGLVLGYDVVSYTDTEITGVGGSTFFTSLFIGARYYVANNIAVFGEAGYGISPLQLGVSFKF